MNFVYETNRLILKVCGEEIAPDVLDFFNHNVDIFQLYEPLVPGSDFFTIEHQKHILNYEYAQILKLSMIRFWLYEKEAPDKLIGTVCFRNIAKPVYASCQLGYKMDRDYTGKGYCKEAIQFGLNLMKNELELHRVEALVMPSNVKSVKLLEGLGFEREGLLREKVKINDYWEDHYLYSCLL